MVTEVVALSQGYTSVVPFVMYVAIKAGINCLVRRVFLQARCDESGNQRCVAILLSR